MTSHSKTRMLLLGAALLVVAVGAFLFVSNAPRGEPSAVEPAAVEELADAEPEALSAATDEEEVAVAPEPVVPSVAPMPTPTARVPEPEQSLELIEFSPLPPNWAPAKLEYGSVLVRVFESPSRTPASNVTVWLTRDSDWKSERTPTTLTDERGECRFERVATGLVEVLGEPVVSTGRVHVAPEHESVVVVAVSRTVLLRGRVLDRNGRPVAGAGIFQLSGPGGEWAPLGPNARTDDAGNYVARVGQYPETLQLCAVGEGFIPSAIKQLELGPFDIEPELDFTLGAEGASITVQVVDGEGTPVPDANVYMRAVFASKWPGIPDEELESWDHNFTVLWSGATNTEGRAELRGLPRREFILTARATGFAPQQTWISLTGEGPRPPESLGSNRLLTQYVERLKDGGTVTLRLDRGLTVEGRVCSPAGVPAAFAVVQSSIGDPPIAHWVRADEEGYFRIFNVSPDLARISAHLDGRTAWIDASAFPTRRTAIWSPVLK